MDASIKSVNVFDCVLRFNREIGVGLADVLNVIFDETSRINFSAIKTQTSITDLDIFDVIYS